MKKKMLVYANYFYPEVASLSQLLTELCEGVSDEFDITVICSVPCYTGNIEEKYKTEKYYYEEYNGIHIIRVRVTDFTKTNKISRVKHILSYFFHAISATKKVKGVDIVYTVSQPPVLGGLLGVIGKKITKAKLVYNIQDFNPEQTIAVGYSKSKLLLKILMMLDKYSCKKSDLVIVVGRDMEQTLIKRFNNKKVPKHTVINNWMNENEVYPLAKNHEKVVAFRKKYNLEDKLVIMYSGNIGLFYDLENIIKVIARFKDEDIVFAFAGEGAMKEKLESYVEENELKNITFIPYQDKKDLIYSLNSADVHIVANAKGIKGVSVPSKIYGILATDVPMIGILEKGSEAWKIIEDSNTGILAEAGNYEQIESVFKEVIKSKNQFVKKHLGGRAYLENKFTKDKSIEKYKKALNKL